MASTPTRLLLIPEDQLRSAYNLIEWLKHENRYLFRLKNENDRLKTENRSLLRNLQILAIGGLPILPAHPESGPALEPHLQPLDPELPPALERDPMASGPLPSPPEPKRTPTLDFEPLSLTRARRKRNRVNYRELLSARVQQQPEPPLKKPRFESTKLPAKPEQVARKQKSKSERDGSRSEPTVKPETPLKKPRIETTKLPARTERKKSKSEPTVKPEPPLKKPRIESGRVANKQKSKPEPAVKSKKLEFPEQQRDKSSENRMYRWIYCLHCKRSLYTRPRKIGKESFQHRCVLGLGRALTGNMRKRFKMCTMKHASCIRPATPTEIRRALYA